MTAGEIEAKAGRLLDRAGLTGPEIAAGLAAVANLPTAGGLGRSSQCCPGEVGRVAPDQPGDDRRGGPGTGCCHASSGPARVARARLLQVRSGVLLL